MPQGRGSLQVAGRSDRSSWGHTFLPGSSLTYSESRPSFCLNLCKLSISSGNSLTLSFRVIARSVSDEAISLLSKRLLRFARNDKNPNFLRSYKPLPEPYDLLGEPPTHIELLISVLVVFHFNPLSHILCIA